MVIQVLGLSAGDCLLSSCDCHQFLKAGLSMSAATSVEETPSPEGASSCHLLVVFEDAVAHDLAMEVCGEVVNRLETGTGLRLQFLEIKRTERSRLRRQGGGSRGGRGYPPVFIAGSRTGFRGHELARSRALRQERRREGALALIIAGRSGARLWRSRRFCPRCNLPLTGCEWISCRCLSPSPGPGPEFSAELPAVRPDKLEKAAAAIIGD